MGTYNNSNGTQQCPRLDAHGQVHFRPVILHLQIKLVIMVITTLYPSTHPPLFTNPLSHPCEQPTLSEPSDLVSPIPQHRVLTRTLLQAAMFPHIAETTYKN